MPLYFTNPIKPGMNLNSLMKLLLCVVIILHSSSSDAQKTKSRYDGKKRANIGFAYVLADFDPSWPKIDSIYGFSVMFFKGLSKRFDISARYNGIFSNKINNAFISPNKNRMSSELEAALHVKALKDKSPVNIFLTGGIGIGNYKSNRWVRYEIGGGGIQVNFKSEVYLLLQAHYRFSLDKSLLPHNMFYSFGLTRSIYSKKKAKPVVKDRDNDGVEDKLDACPDSSGTAALNGCPDKDGDGIADKDDKCPDKAGQSAYQGCPVPDTDNDGVNDENDKCPDVAGVIRYNGCPVPDTDNDGVNNEDDKCPEVKGVKENKGCPPISKEVKTKVVTAAKNILFITGSSALHKKSFSGLDEVVSIMKKNPGMNLKIHGHTDNVGTDENNQRLSENRANAVKEYITGKGIDASRITASGFGESQPIADNKTAVGRQKNRRVELILEY